MVSSEQFYSSTTLWIICHRIAKHREGDLNESDLVQFYEETSARQDQDENCLPTKALMVLMKAHEALGEAQKCDQEEGRFLRFFLDELAETMSLPAVKSAIASDRKYLAIVENVQVEVYQCINCAFGESKSLRKYDDHASQCKWRADWNLAKTILPLLLPQPLPLVYSLEKVSPDLVDVISRIFKFVLEVEPTLEAQLLDFCKQPPVMELREVTDPDGIALEYAEEYQTDEDPRNILSIQSRQYLCDVSEDRKDQLSLSAKCLYLSSLAQHRNNINTPNQDMMRMIRCCLAIANPYLDSQLQSSVWYMYARNLANEYIMLPSHELVDQVDQFLFPFKMSIYLKQDFCEAHLDIATITYQVRTRIKRFSARSDVEEEKRRKARAKMDGMLLKCRVHFELARKHNDSPAEVPWLSTYFLAKIAEKLGEAPEKICKLYHESALALEQEGYLYPQKIHRSKQINFEPLEIHYKLHSYALKKVNEWKNMNKFQLKSSLHSSLSTLHTLSAYLQLFTRHGVETKTARPDLFMEEPNYFTTPMHHQQSTKNSLATDVLATVDNLVDAVSQQLQIQSTCMYAFETIMAKFPHYKACYRMAKLAFVKGDYKACADLLFDRLLLPVTGTAAAKKRGNTTVPPINSSTSLFENVVEISRADIERSGSYAYHIHKIFNLAIISTYKCNDLGRLVLLLSSLATIRNEEQAPDKMGREDIRGLQTKCSNAITKIAPLPKMSTDKLLHNCSLLQDLLRKLKKENNEYVTEIENCLAKCAEKRAVWSNRQQHAEQAARMPQEQEHPTQQLQPAPVEKRNTSPLPLPHATNKIAVITIPETPPRPSTITDHAATATTSASSTSQEHSDLRNVIKQHLLLHRSRKQQHEPAKKAVKRALDGCQTSPDKQQHNGNQSAGGGAPPAKKVTLEVDKNNLSQYFEEVLKRMTPEASAQVVQYIQNPTIDKDEKKRYVLNVLANAGFTMTPSPQKAVNDNAIVATTSFSPTTTDAVCPKPQPQQRPATQTGQQPRKRKVVLMPRDPRLQTSHLNGATTSGVAPASRPPTLPITLQTPSSFSPSLAPIPKPVVANHAPAAAQMSSSSSTLATKPAPITLKPTANQSQPTAITNPNKPKRPRIQAPTKDGQQQHKQNATATKGGVSSSSYASATTYSQQQMSAENIQEYLRLASMLPSSSINEQTLAALREVTKTVAAKAKPVSGRQGSPLIRQPQPSGAANGGLNLSKHNNSGQKPENLVSKPPLQRPLHQPSTSSPFTSPSTHNQQHAQFGRSQVSNSNQHQTHSPLASNKSTSSTTPQHQPSPKPGQSSTSGQPSFHLPHFSSPTSTYNSSPRLSENPPQRLTLPLKQATTSSHKPGRPLDLQAVVRKQKQKTQASQMQKPPLDHTSDNSSSSHINPTSNMQQANLLTQAQLQTHTQALQLEKLQQYLRQQHQQGQQSWMPLLAQQWSQQSSNVPLQSAGTSRKTTPHNGSMEQGLAEIARRFELQKLAFEQRSMKDQAGKRN